MEVFYIWLGCTPMIIINVFCILAYVVSLIIIIKGKKTLITVWIMIQEVYLHVIFTCVFLGLHCGFQLWLFGTLSCIFLPFFKPNLSKSQKLQIGVFSCIIIATFMVLTLLGNLDMMPKTYYVDFELGKKLYYINAMLAFGSIMLYTSVYNHRMARKNDELQLAADHDYLTGVYNRQRIQKILDSEMERVKETGEDKFAVAIADIDYFKKINDNYGHNVGDNALKELTKIFEKNSGTGLTYGRWGGEEFLLIAPEDSDYEEFTKLLEDIRKQVEEHEFTIGGQQIRFTISIGAAAYVKGLTVEQLVHKADDRLYYAKESGRNRVIS